MSDYDKEQKSVDVPQHKRMAMGVPLDGQSLGNNKGSTQSDSESSSKGGLPEQKRDK